MIWTTLFIWTVTAGTQHQHLQPVWKTQWVNGGQFYDTASCNKAAANLGLKTTEYRCINKYGEVK